MTQFGPFLLICAAIVSFTSCKVMLSMYSDQTTSFYQCVKQQGFSTIILQVDADLNGPKQSNIQNIFNAKNAGLQIEFGYVPCRSHYVADQLKMLISQVGKKNINKIWIGPQQSHPKCSWTEYSPVDNCAYLKYFMESLKMENVDFGIGTSRASWPTVFGGVEMCPEVSSAPLWWFPVGDENDGIPSFDKYHQIGGWKAPYMKAYNTFQICGAIGVISYLP